MATQSRSSGAAAISGLKYTTYARLRLMKGVYQDIKAENENRYFLSVDEWDQFLEILESPAEVPGKLKTAQAKFKKKYSK